MKKEKSQKVLLSGIAMVVLFILWTVAISLIDVQPIGPQNSSVGFATLNGFIHSLTGVHMAIYTVTDWLGLIPLCFILGFALLGLIQLIKRKSLFKVDSSILVLGAFYIVVMAAYLFFEFYVVNYRPVLINGFLEASYPSSTTLLVMCVMPTAVMQLNSRIRNTKMKRAFAFALIAFTAFMVIGRLISGVHWITDIIGGAILSAGLVMIYYSVSVKKVNEKCVVEMFTWTLLESKNQRQNNYRRKMHRMRKRISIRVPRLGCRLLRQSKRTKGTARFR